MTDIRFVFGTLQHDDAKALGLLMKDPLLTRKEFAEMHDITR